MGYADGGDLAGKIEKARRKPFSEEDILHDFIEIALAIKYIHNRKILHRDLKGQNVFLMKDGTVKLGDFGIAKVLQNTFQACKTQIGTPYYLSPEMCQGRSYNAKTDIWSLGCILYELCTLKHAFDAANMNQLLMAIIRGRYTPIPSTYSKELQDLVDRMLTKEPEKRPTINEVLKTPFIRDRLAQFLDDAMLEYEIGHTVLHGRKPLAAPTVIVESPARDRDAQREHFLAIERQQEEIEARLKREQEELDRRARAAFQEQRRVVQMVDDDARRLWQQQRREAAANRERQRGGDHIGEPWGERDRRLERQRGAEIDDE
jgi:NIMA (never in mitosis gene a)-related kinase